VAYLLGQPGRIRRGHTYRLGIAGGRQCGRHPLAGPGTGTRRASRQLRLPRRGAPHRAPGDSGRLAGRQAASAGGRRPMARLRGDLHPGGRPLRTGGACRSRNMGTRLGALRRGPGNDSGGKSLAGSVLHRWRRYRADPRPADRGQPHRRCAILPPLLGPRHAIGAPILADDGLGDSVQPRGRRCAADGCHGRRGCTHRDIRGRNPIPTAVRDGRGGVSRQPASVCSPPSGSPS